MLRAVVAGLILFAGGARAQADCADDAWAVREAGRVDVDTRCPDGRARPGDRVTLGPGGFLHLQSSSSERTCVALAPRALDVDLGPPEAPVAGPGLLCGPGGSAYRCLDEAGALAIDCGPVTRVSGAQGRRTVFVLPFEAEGSLGPLAAMVSDVVTARLASHRELDVLSGKDVQRMLQLEAERSAVGCEETSCLAELAGALGAQWVVTGQVEEVDGVTTTSIGLLDAEAAASLGRESLQGRSLEEIASRVDVTVHNLLAGPLGLERRAVPVLEEHRTMAAGETVGAAALTGAGVSAAALLLAVPASVTSAVAVTFFPYGALAIFGMVCSPVCACPPALVVGILGSWWADSAAGVEVSWARALLTGGTAALTFTVAAGVLFGALIAFLAAGAIVAALTLADDVNEEALLAVLAPWMVAGGWLTAAGTAVASVIGGVGAALAYDLGVGAFGDTPLAGPAPDDAPAAFGPPGPPRAATREAQAY